MSTMYVLSVTVPDYEGQVTLQDSFPSEGLFVATIPSNTTKTFSITDTQFGRIQEKLDTLVFAGRCTYSVQTTVDDPLVNAIGASVSVTGVPSVIRTGINLKTLAAYTLPMSFSASSWFVPLRAIFTLTAGVALYGDAQVILGTYPDATDILPPTPLTDMTMVGDSLVIDLVGKFSGIAGNGTIYLSVTTADSGTSGMSKLKVEGSLV